MHDVDLVEGVLHHHSGDRAGQPDMPARVLVVDDNPAILEAFRKIFTHTVVAAISEEQTSLEMALFGDNAPSCEHRPNFQVDLVSDGKTAHDLAVKARREGRPYAVAFVDVRMPAGWDGLTTIKALWQFDPDIQVVICSAYSDYAWDEIVTQLGSSDRWLVLRKPFEVIEVLQMAWALANKWQLQREQRSHLHSLERQVETRATELRRVNRTLQMISRCNDALVQSHSENELLDTVCHYIVEDGGYAFASVGFTQANETETMLPACFAGVQNGNRNCLDLIRASAERRNGPCCRALQEAQPIVARNLSSDAGCAIWRNELVQLGVESVLVLPLHGKSSTMGVLGIYSRLPDAFDDNEVQLLQGLAENLAYGIASWKEIAARERAEQDLAYQSNHDQLTGLPNRGLFQDRLQQAVLHASRDKRMVGVFLVNLGRYRTIRQALDRDTGDLFVKYLSERITGCLRNCDTVARLADDEFAVLISDMESVDDATPIAHKLLTVISAPLELAEQQMYPNASIGISVYPKDGSQINALLRNAEAALQYIKVEDESCFRFYSSEMNTDVYERFVLTTDLNRALANQEFSIHYQPKVNLGTGVITGAEALLRWQHPQFGIIPPGKFITEAEESGLIVPLGGWVISTVCQQMRTWIDSGLPPLPIAVNVSARQLHRGNLAQFIQQALQKNGLDARFLELEITESVLLEDIESSVAKLQSLKAIGVTLTLDDFGTGYSSLSYLQRFPIDNVKIDQTFVRDITTNPEDAEICVAVIRLAHALKLRVTGEGVETEGQMNYLRNHHCDEMQGYYFSRPIPLNQFTDLVQRRTVLPPQEPDKDSRRTLLIVEDEAIELMTLEQLFCDEGYDVLAVDNARDALELLATHDVQVILSDQRMPGMDGTEFFARVRDLYPDTIRIILSGHTDLETVVEAVNRGTIYKFLSKPWKSELLKAQLYESFQYHELRKQSNVLTGV